MKNFKEDDDDYNIENPRIESEGDDDDEYGKEMMRQMEEMKRQGLYQDDMEDDGAEEMSEYGEKIDDTQDILPT